MTHIQLNRLCVSYWCLTFIIIHFFTSRFSSKISYQSQPTYTQNNQPHFSDWTTLNNEQHRTALSVTTVNNRHHLYQCYEVYDPWEAWELCWVAVNVEQTKLISNDGNDVSTPSRITNFGPPNVRPTFSKICTHPPICKTYLAILRLQFDFRNRNFRPAATVNHVYFTHRRT
jgi:hypothetical protein